MVMETQPMHIRIPDFSKLYIFGSIITSSSPNDLDILIVYDPIKCSPMIAYNKHSDTILDLGEHFGLPVHLTLLTPSEEFKTNFISRTGAIEINLNLMMSTKK